MDYAVKTAPGNQTLLDLWHMAQPLGVWEWNTSDWQLKYEEKTELKAEGEEKDDIKMGEADRKVKEVRREKKKASVRDVTGDGWRRSGVTESHGKS